MPYLWIFLILFLFASSAQAVELFGVELAQASRDQLRGAIKNAGVKLVREAGDDAFFDTYEADSLMPGAKFLYLGFTKKDRQFAFAEYRFSGLSNEPLLQRLKQKYGQPQRAKPRFFSDYRYRWTDGSIEINLYSDWSSYATRLVYFNIQNLTELRAERGSFMSAVDSAQEYVQPAY